MTPTYACRCVASIPFRHFVNSRDHRVTANRAARRRRQCPWPGHRPGRREAESIDDGEHGASISGAMVADAMSLPSRDADLCGNTWGPTAGHAGGAILLHDPHTLDSGAGHRHPMA